MERLWFVKSLTPKCETQSQPTQKALNFNAFRAYQTRQTQSSPLLATRLEGGIFIKQPAFF